MVGLDQQSAPKQSINEVSSHVVVVNNKIGAIFSAEKPPLLFTYP